MSSRAGTSMLMSQRGQLSRRGQAGQGNIFGASLDAGAGAAALKGDDDPFTQVSFSFAQIALSGDEALLYGKMTPRPKGCLERITAADILGVAPESSAQPLERRRLQSAARAVPLSQTQVAQLDAVPENWTDPLLLASYMDDVFNYYCHEPARDALGVQDLKALTIDCYSRFVSDVFRHAEVKRRKYDDTEVIRFAYRNRCKKFPGASHADAVFCAFTYLYDSLARPHGGRIPREVFLTSFPRVHRDLFVFVELDPPERADLVKALTRKLEVYKASSAGGSEVKRLEGALTSVRAQRSSANLFAHTGATGGGNSGLMRRVTSLPSVQEQETPAPPPKGPHPATLSVGSPRGTGVGATGLQPPLSARHARMPSTSIGPGATTTGDDDSSGSDDAEGGRRQRARQRALANAGARRTSRRDDSFDGSGDAEESKGQFSGRGPGTAVSGHRRGPSVSLTRDVARAQPAHRRNDTTEMGSVPHLEG
jgi:hypothetical protein